MVNYFFDPLELDVISYVIQVVHFEMG